MRSQRGCCNKQLCAVPFNLDHVGCRKSLGEIGPDVCPLLPWQTGEYALFTGTEQTLRNAHPGLLFEVG